MNRYWCIVLALCAWYCIADPVCPIEECTNGFVSMEIDEDDGVILKGEIVTEWISIEPITLPYTNMAVFSDSVFIYAGPVKICITNGLVTIEEGVTMDEASREFWLAVQAGYFDSLIQK